MGPEMSERGSTTSIVWATFGIFSAQSKWFPVGRDWWPWTKLGYVTMTRRQSNNQWSGGIASHPAPKNSVCKNPLENFTPRFFWDQGGILPLIIFQRAYLSTRSITHLCWCNWRTFWRKNASNGKVTKRSCSCPTLPRLTGHLQPRGYWHTWASSVLITHPFSGSGPVGLPPVPWIVKTIEKSPFFVRRGSHCCRGDLVGLTTFWIFFVWLKKVRATG